MTHREQVIMEGIYALYVKEKVLCTKAINGNMLYKAVDSDIPKEQLKGIDPLPWEKK